MKYIMQNNYPHIRYVTNLVDPTNDRMRVGTFARSGCGLASLMMVADRLLVNYKFDILDAVHMAYETGANRWIGTTLRYIAPVFAYQFGLELEMTDDPQKLLHCLRTGGCAVAHASGDREGRTGVFTHSGHYVTVINEERDGRLAILDPYQTEKKLNEETFTSVVEVKDNIFKCSLETLVEDCKPKSGIPFYLFRRK